MSEKGPIGRTVDQWRERRADKTRVHDKALAEDMARAELPFRDAASIKKRIGKALVRASWANSIRGKATVTSTDLSHRTKGKYPEQEVDGVVSEGVKAVADKFGNTQPLSMSVRGLDRHTAREKAIRETLPTAVPNALAQKVGHELQDNAAHLVEQGIKQAEVLQAQGPINSGVLVGK